jgi:hypothetical protein
MLDEPEADIFPDDHHLPKGLLDSLDPEAPQFVPASIQLSQKQSPPLDPQAPHFVPAAAQQAVRLSVEQQGSSLDPEAPQFVPASLLQQPSWCSEDPVPLLDSSTAQSSQAQFFDTPFGTLPWAPVQTEAVAEVDLASLSCYSSVLQEETAALMDIFSEEPVTLPQHSEGFDVQFMPPQWGTLQVIPDSYLDALKVEDHILQVLGFGEHVPAMQPQVFGSVLSTSPVAALPEDDLGSPTCPTVGSQAHQFGTCRPCAFIFSKGCTNGVLCPFCHLCDPAERKRRAKDKRSAKKFVLPMCQ